MMHNAIEYLKCFLCHVGSSEAVEEMAVEGSAMLSAAERQSQMQHRANASVHVCWHRNTSVGAKDMHNALQVCWPPCVLSLFYFRVELQMKLICTVESFNRWRLCPPH